MSSLKRYDADKDEMVELTQSYFDDLQQQFGKMIFDYSRKHPEDYKIFCDNYKYES